MTATAAILACGALARETAELARRNGWDVDVHGVSAFHHLDPRAIVRAVDRRLADLSRRYQRIVVVFGDCGTGGRLEPVLARHRAVRPAGVHCYQWLAGADHDPATERPGTYFLTDWLVRSWDRAVIRGLGLDRFPWLKETYFGHLSRVVYLRQDADPEGRLERKAREIATFLGLPLEVRRTGIEPLERVLAPLLEEDDVHA